MSTPPPTPQPPSARPSTPGRSGAGDATQPALRSHDAAQPPLSSGVAAQPPLSSDVAAQPPLSSDVAAKPALSAGDAAKLAGLRRMKLLATALLVAMAVIFAVSFALQGRYPWLQYVRAASEGGMVGALADWFAVTALFRRPLGLRIPHTAIIPTRKDEIGASLGEFVEENFLSEAVVREKLASVGVSRVVGGWLRQPANARRVTAELANGLQGAMTFLSDDEIRSVIEGLARTNLVGRDWSPQVGALAARIVETGHHHVAVDLLLDKTEQWLAANPDQFTELVSKRLPSWLPSFASRLVDDRVYREALKFVQSVQQHPDHQLRQALDAYLAQLADDLQHDPAMMGRFELAKEHLLDDPRLRELAALAWQAIKDALNASLSTVDSPLRLTIETTLADAGVRLATDAHLAETVDTWVANAASHLVQSYRHDIAAVISETVSRWDGVETSQKIELQVGRDLQYIRINGTVVGSLAGLAIFAVAQALLSAF